MTRSVDRQRFFVSNMWPIVVWVVLVLVSHGPARVNCQAAAVLAARCSSGSPAIVGYWPSWASTQGSNFAYQNYVLYAFAQVDGTSFKLVPPSLAGQFPAAAKKTNACIKTLLSIGGAGGSVDTFSAMVSTFARRKLFIDNSIAVARGLGFDGLDIDWEFPETQKDMDNLGLLFREWRLAVIADGLKRRLKPLLLSAAVYFTSNVYGWQPVSEQRKYPIASMNANLDWAGLMCFDLHGSWESTTGEHTALKDPVYTTVNSQYAIDNWLAAGMHSNKLLLGQAYYGIQWQLQSLSSTGVGAPTTEDDKDTIAYSDIVPFVQDKATTTVLDAGTSSMYSWNSQSLLWIGYDNGITLAIKTKYAKARGLLGVFAWSLNQDTANFTLARAVSAAWT